MNLIKIYRGLREGKKKKRRVDHRKGELNATREGGGKENGGGDQEMCSQSLVYKRGFALRDEDELKKDDQ